MEIIILSSAVGKFDVMPNDGMSGDDFWITLIRCGAMVPESTGSDLLP